MSTPSIELFDVARHAAPYLEKTYLPHYAGTHIVTAAMSLSDIAFPPEADSLALDIGSRNPALCPKIGELTAVPHATGPLIQGLEKRQQLTVLCPALRNVGSQGIGYLVCRIRAKAAGLGAEHILDEWFDDPANKSRIWCPFQHLGGIAVEGDNTVDVTVTAEHPVKPDTV